MDWNVLTSCWLEVMHAGKREVCSPLWALQHSPLIQCISAGSPVDLFAAHRFLLTLLYWKADTAGGLEKLRDSLLADRVPTELISAIQDEDGCFRLFDDGKPFLQDSSARALAKKSAGSLFAEFACGTNIAHFHHGDDANMRLCLRCATIGMLRLVPWTQSGGAGLSPAVHGAPPIMAVACGRSLATTLGLNLIPLRGKPGASKWTGHFTPTDRSTEIPYLEALTWNSRRVHLGTAVADGACWRCGCVGVPVVGPIVYAKNENTKSNKQGTKTRPFQMRDPSAFYSYAPDAAYVTSKSYDERSAAIGRDLASLREQKASLPCSALLTANPEHRRWRIVIPCTDPKNNKTFDHRQIDLPNLAPEAINAIVPSEPAPARQQAINGWEEPPTPPTPSGALAFVRASLRLLSQGDWTVLAGAANRQVHDSPSAFDLLSGLLWSLRARKVAGLPSRNVAWLVLKLMAGVPSRARVIRDNAHFCPLRQLPKRQPDELRKGHADRSPYPVSLARGQRLEAALRQEITFHLRRRVAVPIDWQGLCNRLNQLCN